MLEVDLRRWAVRLVVNFFDNDGAGRATAADLGRRVRAGGVAYHGAPLPRVR